MSRNIAFGLSNYIADGGAGVSGGSYQAAFPPSNLYDDEPTSITRTTDATAGSTVLDIDLGSARPVRVISELNTNLSKTSTRRITAGSSAGASNLYDNTSAPVWRFDETDFGGAWRQRGAWWGMAPDSNVYGAPWCPVEVLPETITARYWRLTWGDAANVDGFVQLGGLWVSDLWQPEHGAIHGMREGFADLSTFQWMPAGGGAVFLRRAARTVAFDMPLIADGTAEEYTLREAFRLLRTGRPLFFLSTLGDRKRMQMTSFPGRLADLSGFTASSHGRRAVSMKLQEAL